MNPLAQIQSGMWTQRLGTDRCELLIAPRGAVEDRDPAALKRLLGCTLNAPRDTWTTSGPFVIGFAGVDGVGDPAFRPERHRLIVTEGRFPEPLGLRVTVNSGPVGEASWTVESDRAGVRPVYYGFDEQCRPIVSTRPEIIAALIGSDISMMGLVEHMLLGFPLDHHTLFTGVQRARPGHVISHDVRRGFRLASLRATPEDDSPDPHHWVDRLAPFIVAAFERGDAMELTGGADSRLVLAAGLYGGAKPKLAFTLGEPSDEDVRIAEKIARKCHFEHHIVPAADESHHTAQHAWSFVERSGFAVNACSYAWMPAAFEYLAPHRRGQIGGGGGECAAGFYYTPFDTACMVPGIDRMWVHRRLLQCGVRGDLLFGTDRWAGLLDGIVESTWHRVRDARGSWRRRGDEFYLTERVPNAGGPVLSASACWYRPFQPLLSSAYLDWGHALTTARRARRRAQRAVIAELAPALARVPYAGGPTRAWHDTARRLHRRLADRPPQPDLGAGRAAVALSGDPWVQRAVERLASQPAIAIDGDGLSRMMATPGAFTHELGVLITAGWAVDALQRIGKALTPTVPSSLRAAA